MASVGVVAGGALLSGAASVTGLAVATRSLGGQRVGPLAVAWALAVVVGPGLWSAVEQEAARAAARDEDTSAVARVVARRAALAALVVAVAGVAARDEVFRGSLAVPLALAVVAAGYGPLHLAWGRLAGERRSRALATSVAVEGLARLVLVGGTAVVTHDVGASAVALAAAVAVAAVVATVVAGEGTGAATAPGVAARIRSLTGAGLLAQGLFLTSPAVYELLAPAGDPRTARLAMAVVLARAPALAWKGVLAAVVPAVAASSSGAAPTLAGAQPALSTAAPANAPAPVPADAAPDTPPDAYGAVPAPAPALGTVGRAVLVGVAVAAALAGAVAVIAGDPVLDLLTGSGPALGAGTLALLAAATAAYLGALTATSALAGAGRARAAAAAWLAGGVASVAVAAIPGDPLRRVVTALATGTAVALVGVVWACLRQPTEDSSSRCRGGP